jgi:hypothetical protein
VNLFSHRDEIMQMESAFSEEDRLWVPSIFLEQILHDLNEYVQGSMYERVFNLEEVGICESEDRKAGKAVVPATARSQTTYPRISWKLKHISWIAFISAVGKLLSPVIIAIHNPSSVWE